jgi:archaemetzincin
MIRVYQQETLDIFPLAQDVIKDSFSLMAQDQGHITLQKSSYNPLRQQYNAAVILDDIASKNDKDIEYKLCLVNVDIYAQNMNFIFGLANPIRKTAIVSTYRLN